eukprot:TRINITY_DN3035_c0_g1_i1.p1 TRINITY_DN3035_c0_g1~~TRINITY_DN3035_c0_g1_i1.p1  ORF type:complete len:423 (-),score=67.14 TRINITY_DN3035_c0_g1_i1:36-1304(-)
MQSTLNASTQKTPLLLPSEILINVIKLLRFKDILIFRTVCRNANFSVLQYWITANLGPKVTVKNTKDFPITFPRNCAAHLKLFEVEFTNLESILNGWSLIKILEIAHQKKSVTHLLYLPGSTILSKYLPYYQKLQTLIIPSHHINNTGLCAISEALSKLPNFKKLNISDNNEITDYGIGYLATSLPRLEHLDIKENFEIGPEGYRKIAQHMTNLKVLEISLTNMDSSLITLAGSLIALKTLIIEGRPPFYMDAASASILANNLVNLEVLNTKWVFNDESLIAFSAACRMNNLRVLNIIGGQLDPLYPSIGDESLEILCLVPSLQQSLRNLGVRRNRLTSKSMVAVAEYLPFLESVIATINNIDDEGAIALSQLQNLRYLNLEKNPISEEGISTLKALEMSANFAIEIKVSEPIDPAFSLAFI